MIALITSCAALGASITALVITIRNKKKPDFVNIRREEPILSNDQVKREVELQRNYEQYMQESAKFIFRVALEKAYRDLHQDEV
ncbi:hypothetical protein ACWI_33310 [Acetobacterium wieringae]|uniref:Uncharacterized protein n=1 Tax=Acetobacterium wieringae TaxID=52694 RepID=A0A1F2PCQ8_9FIRM|nr:hypothetical protein ACWI_33310 [Acetobacterium wieringae]